MDKFEEREKAFENKFAHDEELEFKIKAKSHKLLGLWVAHKMNMDANQSLRYAVKLVEDNINSSEEHFLHSVINSIKAANINIDERDIKEEYVKIKHFARHEINTK